MYTFLKGFRLQTVSVVFLIVAGVFLFMAPPVSGQESDTVILKGGEQVEGRIVEETSEYVAINPHEGDVRVITRDRIQKVRKSSSLQEKYRERRKRVSPETSTEHFRLAVWCGTVGLKEQQKSHLRMALAINPDHTAARRMLDKLTASSNQEEEKQEDSTRDEEPSGSDQSDNGGSPSTESEGKGEQTAGQEDLLGQLTGTSGEQRTRAKRELEERPADEQMSLLVRLLDREDTDLSLQKYALDRFSTIDNRSALEALAMASVMDSDEEIRDYAWSRLREKDEERVAPHLYANLNHDVRRVRIRLARRLGSLGVQEALPYLANRLYLLLHEQGVQGFREEQSAEPPQSRGGMGSGVGGTGGDNPRGNAGDQERNEANETRKSPSNYRKEPVSRVRRPVPGPGTEIVTIRDHGDRNEMLQVLRRRFVRGTHPYLFRDRNPMDPLAPEDRQKPERIDPPLVSRARPAGETSPGDGAEDEKSEEDTVTGRGDSPRQREMQTLRRAMAEIEQVDFGFHMSRWFWYLQEHQLIQPAQVPEPFRRE